MFSTYKNQSLYQLDISYNLVFALRRQEQRHNDKNSDTMRFLLVALSFVALAFAAPQSGPYAPPTPKAEYGPPAPYAPAPPPPPPKVEYGPPAPYAPAPPPPPPPPPSPPPPPL
ncbi:wiskott-Aldrich syndrome protein homolog [Diaphorina citri]|uniref:Wiskott-Aldrich syndrome protein homolog n=1 Tax=Diaphorina citri TaxID=121845 RepID=A0A1S3DAB2_DIACI|nr:wiskott-Aldrich syndrome protein homolog [Diaphorina citri]